MKKMISTGNCATGICIQGCILGGRWLQIGALVYLYRSLKMKRRSLSEESPKRPALLPAHHVHCFVALC